MITSKMTLSKSSFLLMSGLVLVAGMALPKVSWALTAIEIMEKK
jgi:hypothetical protein